jgi:hypothetical protein
LTICDGSNGNAIVADVKPGNAKKDRALADKEPDETMPAAGPHAKPELTDKEKTSGSGVLPDPARKPKSTEAPTG